MMHIIAQGVHVSGPVITEGPGIDWCNEYGLEYTVLMMSFQSSLQDTQSARCWWEDFFARSSSCSLLDKIYTFSFLEETK